MNDEAGGGEGVADAGSAPDDPEQEGVGHAESALHRVRAGTHRCCGVEEPDPRNHRGKVEPWLSALFQAEHLSLLVGSGLTTAVATAAGGPLVNMSRVSFKSAHGSAVRATAKKSADKLGRGEPNIEDQIRAIRELIGGLRVLSRAGASISQGDQLSETAEGMLQTWEAELDASLTSFLRQVLDTERGIEAVLSAEGGDAGNSVRGLLGGFLLSFASRAATRERLNIFTTNYDRLIEFGCDLLGLRVVDRFTGTLAPVFHSSRLGVDLHYNPPGIRGEPRYLEGVVRSTKLHGSVDWRRALGPSGRAEVQRRPLPFGAPDDHPELPEHPGDSVLIYPNPAKDVETLEYPYAELFRDFAAASCQPDSVVVTYGYGFGDSHVNRILRDMLSLPSTHLVIISFDDAGGRLDRFQDLVSRPDQITLLVGPHFGDLNTLIDHYLPKPAIDLTTARMMKLLSHRVRPSDQGSAGTGEGSDAGASS